VPIRYMGTKRTLAPLVRSAITELRPSGQVADLFSGMGSVAAALAPTTPVLTNDLLAFTTAFARARFLPFDRPPLDEIARQLYLPFDKCRSELRATYARRIRAEHRAMQESPKQLAMYMRDAPHAGSSRSWWTTARAAQRATGLEHYRLTTTHFSSSYFSTAQAIELDSLRFAIDEVTSEGADADGGRSPLRDWLLSGWIGAAAAVINAPGHTAQFLKPSTRPAYVRLVSRWRRSIWATFLDRTGELRPVGTAMWRRYNTVTNQDALQLLNSPETDGISLVYADPPYTKDSYSRYYHVYETLYEYDYPDSVGAGRTRSDRLPADFSLATRVVEAFTELIRRVSERGVPLILSYPSKGLLTRKGFAPQDLFGEFFELKKHIVTGLDHSTLGASKGTSHKLAEENVYVCLPRSIS
jgi:adenine-specific DNA-methyltransferase